jgi:hypothetical protein
MVLKRVFALLILGLILNSSLFHHKITIKIGDSNGYSQMDSRLYSSPRRRNKQGGWHHYAERASYPFWMAAGSSFFDFPDTAGEAPGNGLTLCHETLTVAGSKHSLLP